MGDDETEYVQSFVQGDDLLLKAAIRTRDVAVGPLIKPGGDFAQALRLALADPPYTTRTAEVKNLSFDVVWKVMSAVKEADIEKVVGGLSLEECDVLMKYIYRGLGPAGKKNEVYSALLKWHPVVLKRAGQSSIIRAISEVNQALSDFPVSA